jgi:aspartate/methionine/tyrosine aminotransferase
VGLAREENVALQPGLEFGEQSRGYYRSLNFYSKEVYDEVYDRIERFIKRHKKEYQA